MTADIENQFWEWSTTLYAKPGIKTALLKLQDRHGFIVNLVLWSAWAARRGFRLADHDVAAIVGEVLDLEKFAIYPVRNARRFLSTPRPRIDQEEQKNVRAQLLGSEIAIERLMQSALVRATLLRAPSLAPPVDTDNIVQQANHYFTVCGEYLETPRILADERGHDRPSALFSEVLHGAGWLESDK